MNKKMIRLICLVSAIVLIITGIIYNQPLAVFTKAVKICMECVGIG